jgi:hypothetical protein
MSSYARAFPSCSHLAMPSNLHLHPSSLQCSISCHLAISGISTIIRRFLSITQILSLPIPSFLTLSYHLTLSAVDPQQEKLKAPRHHLYYNQTLH